MDNPAATTEPDILAMSDEEFMNLNSPPTSTEVATEEPAATTTKETVVEEKDPASSGSDAVEDKVEEDSTKKVDPETGTDDANSAKVADNNEDSTGKDKASTAKEPQTTEKTPEQKKADTTAKPGTEPTDYKSFHDTIMKPFKANGKMVTPKSAEEAIQLMQMGANYTRKMQDLVPARKAIMTLESNGLMTNGVLDEGKLSYLIDLDKKNPEAIKKLLKDSGFDAMGYDPDEKESYTPHGNHIVSDSQVVFKAALDDVASTDEGRQTLQEINTNWDQASKDILFKNPDVVKVINDQRASGVYDKIVEEINHQRTVGNIGQSVPFLDAYRLVGDHLQASGAFGQPASTTVAAQQQADKQPIAVRAETPKSQVENSDQVAAAASTRAQNKSAKVLTNPLALSDEEFMKQMSNR